MFLQSVQQQQIQQQQQTFNNKNNVINWETCENGGYFTGKTCKETRDCFTNQVGGSSSQIICLNGECCTTGSLNIGIFSVGRGPVEDKCLKNGGRRLSNSGSCRRHADCNLLIGRLPELPNIINDNQQILCQQKLCCLMPRMLPIGFTDWAQACPQSGGRFIGLFCEMDHHDCQTATDLISRTPQRAICELRRYCCVPRGIPIDRIRRQDLGCYLDDLPTGSRCNPRGYNCLRGEYCGSKNICCLRSTSTNRRPPNPYRSSDDYSDFSIGNNRAPAFCYDEQPSIVTCSTNEECKELTQSCINGLCCTRTEDEWKYACGGGMAFSNCNEDGTCQNNLICKPADYCCECPYGQAAGRCTHGCPPNYSCYLGGGEYCCPNCPRGDIPYGSCFNGECATGYVCSAGNICCKRN